MRREKRDIIENGFSLCCMMMMLGDVVLCNSKDNFMDMHLQ